MRRGEVGRGKEEGGSRARREEGRRGRRREEGGRKRNEEGEWGVERQGVCGGGK